MLYYCYYYYYLFYHHSLGFINKQIWLQSFLYHPYGETNRFSFIFVFSTFLNFICLLTHSSDGKTESLQLLLPFMMDQERYGKLQKLLIRKRLMTRNAHFLFLCTLVTTKQSSSYNSSIRYNNE